MADKTPVASGELESIATEASVLTDLLCYECERHFEQASESTIEDVDAWSHDVAARAMHAGWHFADRKIYCPACWSRRE